MTELDDILKAQSGDREAFGRLVVHHQDLVFGICYGMTTQEVDAEDLAHEAFIEAFLKLRALRDPHRFAGWLRTLTLNVCRMWHRKKKQVRNREKDEWLANPSKQTVHLNGYFDRLSESHRLALALHYWEGLSYEEMARFLNVPIGTVMSRLNRARLALRDVMELHEDLDMNDGRDFQMAVDAEIAALLTLFGDDVDSMERLSVVLEKSPDRFREVIRHVEDSATVKQVGKLIRHFGKPAVDATLGLYFDSTGDDRAKSLAVLHFLMNGWVERDAEKPYVMPMIPGTYLILDAIMNAAHSTESQIELITELLDGCDYGSSRLVLSCALRGYGEPAYQMLLNRFRDLETPDVRNMDHPFMGALRLFASPFLDEILTLLNSQTHRDMMLGLYGAGMLVSGLDRKWAKQDAKEGWAFERRTQGLLFSKQMDTEKLKAVTMAVTHLLSHSDRMVRIWAIDILKQVPLGGHLAQLRDCLSHEDEETQVAAMRTLAELGDRGCVHVLVDAAKKREGLVLRKTIEALAHLRAPEAQPLMVDLLNHSDRAIQEAAILGLGNVGNEDARRSLRKMTTSSDKKIARLAARALYGGDQYRNRPKASALTRARLQKIRGDAKPNWLLHRSIVAAIKCLPEMRLYEETDLTQHIAKVCADYSTTRRQMVSGRDRVMTRDKGMYQFTPMGEAVWRVEQFIQDHYLCLERY